MDEVKPAVKKTTRARKTVSTQTASIPQNTPAVVSLPVFISQTFDELTSKLLGSKQEFDNLQKEITEIKQD